MRSTVAPLDRAARWCGHWLLDARTFKLGLPAYLLLLYGLRGFMIAGGANDDSEQLLYSQSFALGYGISNPPLYTWLVMAATALFAVTLPAVVLVKFVLLGGAFFLFYACARRAIADERWAVAAALSPLALYYVAWDAIRNYSHSIQLILACAATLYVLLRLDRSGARIWYLVFGLVVGLGILSKYNYLAVLVALLGAALCDPGFRSRLIHRYSLIAAGLAIVLVAPHGIWVLDELGAVEQIVTEKFAIGEQRGLFATAAAGLLDLTTSLLGVLSPLLPLLLLFFWRALAPLPAEAEADERRRRIRRLLGLFLLLLTAEAVVAVLLSGATRVKNHILFVFVLFPLWFFARAQWAAIRPQALDRFVLVVALLAASVPLAMVVKYLTDPLSRSKPYLNVPYRELALQLRVAGFHEGTVLAADKPYPISGNLRPYFPEARFMTTKFPYFQPPARNGDGQCLLVWEAERRAGIDDFMLHSARETFGIPDTAPALDGKITLPFVNGWGRAISFGYRLYPEGAGRCR